MNRLFIIIIVLASVALETSARQPRAGYRGFFEWSNDYRTEKPWPGYKDKILFSGISTSHGCQICPELFVGIGFTWEALYIIENFMFAWYLHGRTDLKFGPFTPFGEIRLGYSVSEGGGIFFSPAIGYRFNWGRKVGFNIGVGLTLQGYKDRICNEVISPEGQNSIVYCGVRNAVYPYFSFKAGIDF